MRDLILQLSKSSIYSTKPTTRAGNASSRRMAISSPTGPNSPSSACWPAEPAPWGYDAIAVVRLTVLTHAFSARLANPKPAAAAASRAPSNGSPNSSTFCPTATGSTSPSPCLTCCGLSSTTTCRCSTTCFAAPPVPCSGTRASGHRGRHLLRPAHLRPPAQSASAHPRLNYPRRSRYQARHLARSVLQKAAG